MTSDGMPLSGVFITSWRTVAALSSRSVAFSFVSSAQLRVARLAIASANIIFFIRSTFRVTAGPFWPREMEGTSANRLFINPNNGETRLEGAHVIARSIGIKVGRLWLPLRREVYAGVQFVLTLC